MRFGDGYLADLCENIVVKTPAIRSDLPEFAQAEENGSVLTSEAEIFCNLCPCKIIAVTGSDGKTTTTTLISEMLSAETENTEKRVLLGGDIGTPLLPKVGEMRACDFAVLELSSFQLHRNELTATVSRRHNEYIPEPSQLAHIYDGICRKQSEYFCPSGRKLQACAQRL